MKLKKKLKTVKPIFYTYRWLRTHVFSKIYRHSAYRLYQKWITQTEPRLWRALIEDHEQSTRFSIVVPVYNPPLEHFIECIESVLSQTYTNWELVLVDDASTDSGVESLLASFAVRDPRINVITHEKNQHISISTNTGIESASGDYIVFLDHDDLLSPHALNELATEILAVPLLKWLYSDEDLIDEKGRRVSPHFKSDWNLYLLRSHNYITHLCCYEREFLIALGGCRPGYEGAQDYDLALRAANALPACHIKHITKVLYHWRMHKNSTAFDSNAKSYTVEAGRKALKSHLAAAGVSAEVNEQEIDNFYQVKYATPEFQPLVSIVIPTRDHWDILKKCVESIFNKTNYPNFELFIVNNQSSCAKTLAYLREINSHPQINVIDYDAPFNYSKLNNFAVDKAQGEYVLLLNNDTEVISSDWLGDMLGIASQPGVGCVGAKLLYPDNTIQHAGVILGLGGYAAHSHRGIHVSKNGYQNRLHSNQCLSAVTAACLLINKDTFNQVNGLDEAFEVAYNDVDFCLRVQELGLNNVYCSSAILYHYESKSRGHDLSEEKQARFEREKALLIARWASTIERDPFYSPHLTRRNERFSIAHG